MLPHGQREAWQRDSPIDLSFSIGAGRVCRNVTITSTFFGTGDTHTEEVCLVDGEHEYNHTTNETHTVEVVGYADSDVQEGAGGSTSFVVGECVDVLIRVTTTSASHSVSWNLDDGGHNGPWQFVSAGAVHEEQHSHHQYCTTIPSVGESSAVRLVAATVDDCIQNPCAFGSQCTFRDFSTFCEVCADILTRSLQRMLESDKLQQDQEDRERELSANRREIGALQTGLSPIEERLAAELNASNRRAVALQAQLASITTGRTCTPAPTTCTRSPRSSAADVGDRRTARTTTYTARSRCAAPSSDHELLVSFVALGRSCSPKSRSFLRKTSLGRT